MSLKTWAGATALVGLFKHIRKGGSIAVAADQLDAKLDAAFPKRSENIQQHFIAEVLLPFGRRLLREDQASWARLCLGEHDRTKKALN